MYFCSNRSGVEYINGSRNVNSNALNHRYIHFNRMSVNFCIHLVFDVHIYSPLYEMLTHFLASESGNRPHDNIAHDRNITRVFSEERSSSISLNIPRAMSFIINLFEMAPYLHAFVDSCSITFLSPFLH